MTRSAYYVLSTVFGRKVKHVALCAGNMLLFTPPYFIEISHQQRTLAMVQAPFVPYSHRRAMVCIASP